MLCFSYFYFGCSYELQIEDSARGKGLGEYLVKLLEDIGRRWKMDKVMLTVFKGTMYCCAVNLNRNILFT